MFDLYFIVGFVVFCILCFFEIVVFNEEVLLTICFFSFIFFCFNVLSGSVLSIFTSRSIKFESDLLASYSLTKNGLLDDFSHFCKFSGFFTKFNLFLSLVLIFLDLHKNFSMLKISSIAYTIGFNKINELALIGNKFSTNFQNNCVIKLLYPLINQTITYNLTESAFNKATNKQKTNMFLKFIK